MAIVTQYSWETETFTHHTPSTERQAFRDAVALVAQKAREKLPECNGRVEKAVALVLSGDVTLQADGSALVGSQCHPETVYTVIDGTCTCKDFPRAPHGFCKHRLGVAMQRRAVELTTHQTVTHDVPTPSSLPDSLKPYIVHLHGKPFVQYAGLLALAHQRGLVSLTAKFISVTADCALAEASAVFDDGKHFTEAADATPGNVGTKVKAHFARMALTRSKARVLRDALNIHMCSVEELEGA